MPDKPGTDVAVFDPETSNYPVLFSQEGEGSLTEVLADNFGDEGFSPSDLDRLTVPSGGGLAWTIPDEDPVREVVGVVIHKQPTRSMWFKRRGEDGEEDGPPDCYSPDAKMGVGALGPGSESNPSGACETCPMNAYGTATQGEGKACKEQMQLFVLREGSILPTQISLPPTSLQPWKKYMTRLASKGKSFFTVVTAIGLEVKKANGNTFSVIVPRQVEPLAALESTAARSYGNTIKGTLNEAAAARARAEESRADADAADAKASVDAGKPAK